MSDGKLIVDVEQGWEPVRAFITKMEKSVLNVEDYMQAHSAIYSMCIQISPYDLSQPLYDRYRETVENYLSSTVVPLLHEKHGEYMLEELVQRWSNHKTMVRSLSICFRYLDRFFIPRRSLPTLTEVGLTCFRDMVLNELNGELVDAVIDLVDREREGGQKINRGLFKSVDDVVSLVNEESGGEKTHGTLLNEVAGAFVEVGALIDEEREARKVKEKMLRSENDYYSNSTNYAYKFCMGRLKYDSYFTMD